MVSKSVTKTRNRRPQNNNDDKDDETHTTNTNTAKVRRERNRQAQHVFRIRKQAEQREKDQHIQKLESEIEEMGSVFFDLADAITRSEHAQADAQLMQTLRNSMKRVVRLGNDSVEHESDSDPCQTSSEDPMPVEPVEVPSAVDTPPLEVQVYDPRANDDLGMLGSRMFNITPGYHQPNIISGSLSNRIIQESLRYGYMVLSSALETSNETVQRLFQFTLKRGTRQETLTNMQWALGPGNWFMPILASHNFHGEVSKNILRSLLGQKGDQPIDPDAAPHRRDELLMNALEVEKYIMSRSTGYVTEDILELAIGTDKNPNSRQESQNPHPEDLMDFDVFFPTERGRTGQAVISPSMRRQVPRILRISQSRLIQNIAYVSICTSDGPGYPTEYLERVILSSTVKSY